MMRIKRPPPVFTRLAPDARCREEPRPQGSGPAADAAPAFALIVRLPSTTAMPLRATLMAPHGLAPDHQLSQSEMNDIIAHMLGLCGR
jgi:hypothetical protein